MKERDMTPGGRNGTITPGGCLSTASSPPQKYAALRVCGWNTKVSLAQRAVFTKKTTVA